MTEHLHLLHILHELQQKHRYISEESICEVAAQLSLPVSQVRAVVAFYAFFYSTPCGHYHILFSNCTSCGYRAGGTDLIRMLSQKLSVNIGQTRKDGQLSIHETSCIGMCDHGASLLINGVPLIHLDSEKIEQITDLIEADKPLNEWPLDWFHIKDHIYKRGLLLEGDLPAGDGLRAMLARGREETLTEITQSKLRGRGGAGFSTGLKWHLCQQATGEAHYVVCNADEGEPGTFKDRMLLQQHADALLEGMTICAYVIGAYQGFIYLRGEYRYLLPHLQATLLHRRKLGLLGTAILGQTGFDFDIDIVVGAGAYICGEESALIESLEGKPGIPRSRPPFPVAHGYLGQPTVVNNVETFIAATHIVCNGSEWFTAAGTTESTGSKLLSISGDCAAPGIYEYSFGVTIQQVLEECGADNVQAVQVGGPAGTLLDQTAFHRQIAFEDVGTGGSFMIFNRERDILAIIHQFAAFFAHESCGFCTPCRVGTTLLKQGLNKIIIGQGARNDMAELQRVSELVRRYSHCGLGHTAANPILDGLQHFPQAFEQQLTQYDFTARFELDAALQEARQLTQHDDKGAHLKQEGD
ncbi:NAD(P)H-dependent oxidoreductase subunit E [Nitrosomonas communis]|uniref:[NiFe] hydrogenase diaphorase moiety large subunit n=1 Tax=Nitrosomonas communis TaxID=44574 RepID=A0A1I4NSE0_9PROT|nr:NAD(P)H-dependent oxidoreductase subunit E [Nitrosomonas communis]SFM18207.1 [NiFe] hydrogenase diaphorase moiety large subunit [Nitrosomonas communis]